MSGKRFLDSNGILGRTMVLRAAALPRRFFAFRQFTRRNIGEQCQKHWHGTIAALVAMLVLPLSLAQATPMMPDLTPNYSFGTGTDGDVTLTSNMTIQQFISGYNPGNGASLNIPEFNNLTIPNGVTLSVGPFTGDAAQTITGTNGGILRFRVRGTLTIESGGAINATGAGYIGGVPTQTGGSWGAPARVGGMPGRNIGGGGSGSSGYNTGVGGGGGGNASDGGGGLATGGGAGGEGGFSIASAGGSYLTDFPFPRFGSGGGGAMGNCTGCGSLGNGGNGGGVIVIEAAHIVNNGSILANGQNGQRFIGPSLTGAGGGGAGGGIWIQSLDPQNGLVLADGGGSDHGVQAGGDGGAGDPPLWNRRVRITQNPPAQGGIIGVLPSTPGNDAQDSVPIGTTVTLTATPISGWVFSSWTGLPAGAQNTNPTSFQLFTNLTISATFLQPPVLSVTPLSLSNISSDGGDAPFTVQNTGGGTLFWSAQITSGGNAATITTPASASGQLAQNQTAPLVLSFSKNSGGAPRTVTVVVTDTQTPGNQSSVTATQLAPQPELNVTPISFPSVGCNGGKATVQVKNAGTGTMTWSASVSSGGSFAQITTTTFSPLASGDVQSLDIQLDGNATGAQRTAIIDIQAPGALKAPQPVNALQESCPIVFNVNPTSMPNVNCDGDTVCTTVSNNGAGPLDWTATMLTGGSYASFSGPTGGRILPGQPAATICLLFPKNPGTTDRVVTFQVSGGATTTPPVVTATQTYCRPHLEVSPNPFTGIGCGGGDATFQVKNTGTGDMTWSPSVSLGGNYAHITTTGILPLAPGTQRDLVVHFDSNASGVLRQATVHIDAPGAENAPQDPVAKQDSCQIVFGVEPQSFPNISCKGNQACFAVSNSGTGPLDWTANITSGANFTKFSGANLGQIPAGGQAVQVCVTFDPNPGTTDRVATIDVSGGPTTAPVKVTATQTSCVPVLSVTQPSTNVDSKGGTINVKVKNSGTGTMTWTAAPDQGSSFSHIAPQTVFTDLGSGAVADLWITLDQNPALDPRSATINVVANGAQGSPAKVTVNQEPTPTQATLTVDPLSVNIGSDGGDATITVHNVGTGTMTWSAAITSGPNFVTLTLPNPIPQLAPSDKAEFKVTVKPNLGDQREAHVQVSASGAVGNPQNVVITQDMCSKPTAPGAVAGSAGTYTDKVVVQWQQVNGATGYKIYRAVAGDTHQNYLAQVGPDATSYVDATTAAATKTGSFMGCGGKISTTEYTYWITSLGNCGESDYSNPGTGYRGYAGNKSGTVTEKALPHLAGPDSPLYVRLSSDTDIDGSSVWATIDGVDETAKWLPISATDGWVVCQPQSGWGGRQKLSVTVGANTSSGTAVEPVAQEFLVDSQTEAVAAKSTANVWQPAYTDFNAAGLDLTAEGNEIVAVSEVSEAALPALTNNVGPAYSIGPDQPFEKPQRVWLPLPNGLNPGNVQVNYYHAGDNAGWYAAEDVEGWIVPESHLVVTIKGMSYLGFLVRHSGVAQLGEISAPPVKPAPAGVLFASDIWRQDVGDLVVLVLLLSSLVVVNKRRQTTSNR